MDSIAVVIEDKKLAGTTGVGGHRRDDKVVELDTGRCHLEL